MEERIKQAIEDIRPSLQADGGDIEFVSLSSDNVVSVKLTGACHGCPHAQMTLKMGVEKYLKDQVPEVQSVESV
ncbi:MAG: NifU family protein [Spirochaetales bacterium]|nr:NifU family protein [Spirochaetales bacterium]